MFPSRLPLNNIARFKQMVSQPVLGIFLALCAFLAFSSADTLVKILSNRGYPVVEILFVNAVAALLPVLFFALLNGQGVRQFRTHMFAIHIFRGIIAVVAGVCTIYAFSNKYLTLLDIYVLLMAIPLFTTLLSKIIFHERIGKIRLQALVVGFVGLIIAVNPWRDYEHLADLKPISSVLMASLALAGSILITRRYGHRESGFKFSFYTSLTTVALVGGALFFHNHQLASQDIPLFLLMGCMTAIGTVLMPVATTKASAIVVSPLHYSQLIWGAIFGYYIFHNGFDWTTIVGGLVLFGAGLIILAKEFKLGLIRVRKSKKELWNATNYWAVASCIMEEGGTHIIGLLDPKKDEKILDLGCGEGTLTKRIALKGANVTGIDSSFDMIRAAKQAGNHVYVDDARTLLHAQHDGPYDAVFSNAVLHWIPEQAQVITAVHRVLKPSGKFVGEMGCKGNLCAVHATILNYLREIGEIPKAIWMYPSPETFRRLLEENGFEVDTIQTRSTMQHIPGQLDNWLRLFTPGFFTKLDTDEQDIAYKKIARRLRPILWDEDTGWSLNYERLRFVAYPKEKEKK